MAWATKLKAHLERLSEPEPLAAEFSGSVSSVLVPVGWNRETGRDEIVLTKRTMKVETHKGQVSFPGGYKEPHDDTLLQTALRESCEEVGLRHGDVEVLGRLTPVLTRGSVVIYPFVGRIQLPYDFVVSEAEVDKLLFLPVKELMEVGLVPTDVAVGPIKVKSIGITVDGELVWGATAKMLEEFRNVMLSLPYEG